MVEKIPQSLPGGRFTLMGIAYIGKAIKNYKVKTYYVGKNEKGNFEIVDYPYEAYEFTSFEELKEGISFVMSNGLVPNAWRCGD